MTPQPEGGDLDHVPNKRMKQFLSVIVAMGAMLSYALVTGMVSLEHFHTKVQEEPQDSQPITAQHHYQEEEGEG